LRIHLIIQKNIASWCVALGLCATAHTSELVRRDLTIAIDGLPTPFDYDIESDGSGSRSGSDSFDKALGLRIYPQWGSSNPGASVGWIAGVGLHFADYNYASYLSYQMVGLDVLAGGSWAFADGWQASLAPTLGYGFGRVSISSSSAFNGLEASGTHLIYGVRGGATYAWTRKWLIGLEVGYLGISSSLKIDDGRTMSIEQDGPTVALSLTWRWNADPARLE
jgi:hypothetical protein